MSKKIMDKKIRKKLVLSNVGFPYVLWYSPKQEEVMRGTIPSRSAILGTLKSGEVVCYTECISANSGETSNWDDAVCYGRGRYGR